jgi:hypothetical protein
VLGGKGLSPGLFMLVFAAAIFRIAGFIVSAHMMDTLKSNHREEWVRLGKPSGWWGWSHFWWFWYVLCGSYRKTIFDEDTLSSLSINRWLLALELAFVAVALLFWWLVA